MSCWPEVEIMFDEEDAQPEFVHIEALGEGKGFAHEAADALPGRAEEALGMAGFPGLLGAEPVRASWEYSLVSKPEVAACGATGIVGRQRKAQPKRALFRAVSKHVGDDLTGATAE